MDRRDGLSFQSWLVRQPVRLGGLGLRSLADTCPAAFLGALETALPSFVGEHDGCTVLEDLVGPEVAGEGARWQSLLQFNCRTG